MSEEANAYDIFGLLIDKEIALLFLGAIIGFGASLITNWINNRVQRNKEEKEKAINIISDVVKFVTKANETVNDYKVRIEDFQRRAIADPTDKEIDREQRAYVYKIMDELTDFFIELNFYSFQLEQLDNKQLTNKFERLMNTYHEYFSATSKIGREEFSEDIRKKNETKFKRQYKNFINYCIETCKATAPKRTLSAPGKKKGPRRKS